MSLPEARWWHRAPDGRAACDLCPRACLLGEGQAGWCGVRVNQEGLRTTVDRANSGLCVDPMEKKPLYHFLPGTRVLSYGTFGCNLGCRFCQNWTLSRAADPTALRPARPEEIVRTALAHGCSGVAFTYNEPIVSAEYGLEVAQAAREAGLATLAVTAGYVSGQAREDFFRGMDAANVDLKGFTEAFYRDYCGARLAPVLETLEYLARETDLWLELTTLLIPGANDGPEELEALAAWVAGRLGPDIPLHFSAFHPDYRLQDRPPTPLETLRRARDAARQAGSRYVYLGNVRSREGSDTPCPGCGRPVIERTGFQVTALRLSGGRCTSCGAALPGRFAPSGRTGTDLASGDPSRSFHDEP